MKDMLQYPEIKEKNEWKQKKKEENKIICLMWSFISFFLGFRSLASHLILPSNFLSSLEQSVSGFASNNSCLACLPLTVPMTHTLYICLPLLCKIVTFHEFFLNRSVFFGCMYPFTVFDIFILFSASPNSNATGIMLIVLLVQ